MSLDTTASRSAATRPLSRGLVSHRTSWNPGGRFGIPPEAKLPSSHTSSTFLHSIGYLTATTKWYVTGLTRELDGRTNPHAWILATPDVSELSVACRSLAMGSSVTACCSIHARRIRDLWKLTTEPCSRSGSTTVGQSAISSGLADSKALWTPGRISLVFWRSAECSGGSSSVHTLPSLLSPACRMSASAIRLSLDELLRRLSIASASV